MRRTLFIALCAASALVAGPAVGQDADELISGCADCHGEGGVSPNASVPTLAGQSDIVVSDWIWAFQDQTRPCEDEAYPDGMSDKGTFNHCDHFADWSEDDMMVVGEYYADQSFVAADQEADASLVSTGQPLHDDLCEKCHTDNGANRDDDAGILAGQWIPYLEKTMNDYLAGDRDMPKKMAEKMEGLSAEDVAALAHFYGAQTGG